ncbi:MAG TPA: tetratricopeptide repeat protein [Kofleriaceae bacterium]|jgi:TolA-binding protein
MRSHALARWLAAALVCTAAGSARADNVDKKLAAYEQEAHDLGQNLPRPNELGGHDQARKLVDAEVAYSLGDYDSAALVLFELASHPGPDQETATYYLGESLYQKGDRGAARGYFAQIAATNDVSNKYYQPSLLRLVEIAIAQHDSADVQPYLDALDHISPGLQLPSVKYVRGKWSYANDKYDEALAYFADVPKGSDFELQALYFTGTTYVAKQDVARATDIFADLVGRKPRTTNDRRVIELSQLALGRVYYEKDQPGKAIDAYLQVDRHSDLFPDALYEVAWVYVKGKQFDKALRALELLALSEPQSTKTPTVRILEGNLRIRKAQMLRAAEIGGTLDVKEQDTPAIEYDKATAVFTDTHDQYLPSYAALVQLSDAKTDPAKYLAQLAGRQQHVFQAVAPLPEAAAQYLREEPSVQRVVNVEGDLGAVQSDIRESEAVIARLSGVLAANDKTAVYPALATRRTRIGEIEDDLNRIRAQLADAQPNGAATDKRRALMAQAAQSPEQAHVDRVAQTRQQYDNVDQQAAEVAAAIDSTQAVAVAVRKYVGDASDPALVAQRGPIDDALSGAAKEAEDIEDELDDIHREVQIGKDLAEVGDEQLAAARAQRAQLKAALDDETRGRGGELDRAARIADQLAGTEQQIDAIAEQGLAQMKRTLDEERENLAAYKKELAEHEAESRSLGGTVLGASFATVKAKFYDIVVRTDVGNVDVSWSEKEDNDDDLKRLNLQRTRELKTLKDEFHDILQTDKPAAPKQPSIAPPAASPPPTFGSPDSGGSLQKAGPDKPATNGTSVKPDAGKTPKTAPKKGGAR